MKLLKLNISAIAVFAVLALLIRHMTIPPVPWNVAGGIGAVGAWLQILIGGIVIQIWKE